MEAGAASSRRIQHVATGTMPERRASTLLDRAPEHMLEPFAKVRHEGEEQTRRRAQSAWRLCLSVALGGQVRLETWMWARVWVQCSPGAGERSSGWRVGGQLAVRMEQLQEDMELEEGKQRLEEKLEQIGLSHPRQERVSRKCQVLER